ncbi:MAG: protein kinase [Polyangiaceae bacterium]|nr:protein kinase [Polyangiaceae bacterium]
MQIAPGLVIADKYEMVEPLARGGMGSVWIARHTKLGNTVAVKFLDGALLAAPGMLGRFEREARAAANLDTPHVVRVSDYGVDHQIPYLVMELLRGEDLKARLSGNRRLPIADISRILTQMVKALRKAHEAGIVHRDLKPANVFLAKVDDEEVVKILDFGIAKEAWSRVEDSTKTGEVFGSPHYMSPEQARAQKTVDQRADVWATGVILYRMLTGHLPFPGEVLGEVLSSVLVDPTPKVQQFVPGLPNKYDGFFERALAKRKEDRFSSMDELLDGWSRILKDEVVPSPTAAQPLPVGQSAHRVDSGGSSSAGENWSTAQASAFTVPLARPTPATDPATDPAASAQSQMLTGQTGPSIAGSATNIASESNPFKTQVSRPLIGVLAGAGLTVLAVVGWALSSSPAASTTTPDTAASPATQNSSTIVVIPTAVGSSATSVIPTATAVTTALQASASAAAPKPVFSSTPTAPSSLPTASSTPKASAKPKATTAKPDPRFGL